MMIDTEKEETVEQGTSEGQDPVNDHLDTCRAELADMKSKYLYLNAEFENYKRRVQKEQGVLADAAQDRVLVDVLSIIDDLERAVAELKAQTLPSDLAAHFEGISIIVKNIGTFLQKYTIKEVSTKGSFDPHLHEAVMQQPSAEHEPGSVLKALQKGYIRHERVLRPAKVIVTE